MALAETYVRSPNTGGLAVTPERGEARTLEQLREDYEIEKQLAGHLRRAS
jgi:hypothetical protein